MTTANEHVQAELTQRDVDLQRYQRGVVARVFALLQALQDSLLGRMVALDPTDVQPRYRDARLVRLLAEVGTLVDKYGEAMRSVVLPDMTELAVEEARFGRTLFDTVLPGGVGLETVAPSAANLRAAVNTRPFQGKLLREWVADNPPAVRARLRGVIQQGVAEGKTIDAMVRDVRGTAAAKYADGVMEVNRRGAEAMVRTAVSHVVSAARGETYDANADLVKGVRMVATLDSRTTVFCVSIDGKVFPLKSGPRPPFHVRCRTTSVPVLKSWKELGISLPDAPEGTRASLDGQVAGDTTYGAWLRTRSAAFQDEVLGKTRAELWRKGGLTVDKFSDASSHVYTIDELRRRNPAAFERAGL